MKFVYKSVYDYVTYNDYILHIKLIFLQIKHLRKYLIQ